MEALLVLSAIFFLIVCPIWVIVLLSGMRRSLDRMADDVRLLHMASCRSADGSSAPATIPPPLPVAPRAAPQPLDEPRTPLDERIAAAAARKAVTETPKSRKPDIPKPEIPNPEISPPVPLPIQPETPVVAPTPSEPTKIERWAEAAWEWLRVGEAWRPGWIPGQFAVAAVQLMRAAALLLLFGAAWTVRYIHERGWLPPGWRIAAGFAVAVAIVVAGEAVARRRYRPVGLALVGVGLALAEFIDFAGSNLYHVLNPGGAFAIAALVTAIAGAFAWRHRSLFLALASLLAGYTAPLFFPEAVPGGAAAKLGWLLLLAAEAAFLAAARGWHSLPWVSLPAGFMFAVMACNPGVLWQGDHRVAILFHAAHWMLAGVLCLGESFRRRRTPLPADLTAWILATAVSALCLTLHADNLHHVVTHAEIAMTPLARTHWHLGIPSLGLAIGSAFLAWLHLRRGIRSRLPLEGLATSSSVLALLFLGLSLEDAPQLRTLSFAVAAVAFVWATARWGSVCAALLGMAAWALSLALGAEGLAASAWARAAHLIPPIAALWASGFLLRRMASFSEAGAYAPLFLWGGCAGTFAYGTYEISQAFPDTPPALAIAWSLYALAMLATGLQYRRRDVRGMALALFALAAGKFLFVDQAGASTPARVVGFLGVGLLLLIGSAAYIRVSATRDEKNQPPN